jgi:outer membrane protein OmpA-like peptidoglycan-associated protein
LDIIENISEDYLLENVGFNSSYSDFGASINGSEIYFASSRAEEDDIYQWNQQPFLNIYKVKEGSSKVAKIQGDVNSKYHESSPVFTKDGKTMYFTRNNYFKGNFKKSNEDVYGLKIYKATLKDSLWTNIVSLPFNNDNYNVAHPALSVDEKKLYFASDMPGTRGSSDIFVVDINDDETYGEPENLGPKINTEGRENFPFVSNKNILYFSSDGHLGLGGLDVFKIEMNTLNEGSTGVQNLGKPINSPKDDFGYIINETSGKGYISSNREGGKGDDDIYSFVKPLCFKNITGTVVNKKTQEALSNSDVFVYDANRNLLKSLKSNDSGQFLFELSCSERTYLIEAKKENYKDDFTDFSIKPNESAQLKLELKLEPAAAKVGTDLTLLLNLKPIYFDYDKSYIRPDAEIELAKVIEYMKAYPNVKIDVRSHTDSRGKDTYNLELSNRRNKATREYIIKKGGISPSRLTGRGYGETQLINRCTNAFKTICSEEEHQANRRSEFIVIEN